MKISLARTILVNLMIDLLIDNYSNLVYFISGRLSTYYDFNWSTYISGRLSTYYDFNWSTYLRNSSPDVFRAPHQSWSVQPVKVFPSRFYGSRLSVKGTYAFRLFAKSAKSTYASRFSSKGTTDEKFVSFFFPFLYSATRASWLLVTYWNFLYWLFSNSP